ncbi:GNAT family N-acetyltransferase [Streptomyces sp. NPDC008317]|uniref:GNAT family N-acetyltransferase n=1 Tax=Streptomyces sp. NPDC008317 TaxID=3364827 RepID=UPI0036EACCB7
MPAVEVSAVDLHRIASFRAAFQRRQARCVVEFPGGAAVLNGAYAASHEHNQIVVEGPVAVDELPAFADAVLAHLPHRRISVLDDEFGVLCAPTLLAAGYEHETELVMRHSGPAPAPDPAAETVTPRALRSAVLRQTRQWLPKADDEVLRQLTDRRAARLRGADQVRFLAVRDEQGAVGAWTDLYLDPAEGIAQIEEVVTATTHQRRGYADVNLATAVHLAAGCPLLFLIADADDWPRTWYARRGFTPIGRSHVFTRAA